MKRTSLVYIVLMLSLLSCRHGVETGIVSSNLSYARELSLETFENYSVATVRNSWDTLRILQRYVLVDRDAEIPENLPEGTIIRTPVKRAAVYASAHASIIEELGCADAIRALCEPEYLSSADLRSRVASGEIADLGLSTSPSIEKIIDAECEIIIASPFENSGFGAAEKLGIPIVQAADYMENHPLGRTEWVKLYGLLFGAETQADSIFNATTSRYLQLRELTSSCTEKPSVLLEKKYGSAWGIASAESYIATIHKDAGAFYPFMDYHGTGSSQLSFETVYDRAADADFWLFKYASESDMTYDDLRSEYEPYANFAAFRNRRVFVCNSLKNSYFDDITLHPDYFLEDLIHIYHPELLPSDFQSRYFLPLERR